MHISIVTGSSERTLQLIIRCLYSIVLTVSILALVSCAPSRPDDRWDPLQPESLEGNTVASGGMARTGDRLSPAMADLIGRADQAIEQQRWSDASQLLERALRVNPKQPEAWTRMAVVKLGTGNAEQSLQMARKSNRHAGDRQSLRAYNWLLISRAHEQLGQTEQAQKALQQSRLLQDGEQ